MWIFLHEFQMVEFLCRSSVSTIKRSPVHLALRIQGVSNEYSRNDVCTEPLHSILVFWWYGIEFYFCSKWNDRAIERWIEPSFIRCGHLLVNLAWLLPDSFCSPDWTKTDEVPSFNSSYRSFCNSICFGSARRWCLMIPSQLCASFNKCQRIVCIRGSWVFFWTLECSEDVSAFLELVGFCMDNLETLVSPSLARSLHICHAI